MNRREQDEQQPDGPGMWDAAESCRAVNEHCVTCSDEALPARVVQVDQERGVALVALDDGTIEVDISLVEDVVVDCSVLVHGGVAIARV